MHATLYTFLCHPSENDLRPASQVKVVRITNSSPDDWHSWPSKYSERRSNLELQEINAIECVDERAEV